MTILWIPIGECQYKETSLKDYQPAWNPSRPLDSLDAEALKAALSSIGDTIQEALNPEPDFKGFFGEECLAEPYPAVFLDAELPRLKGTDLRIVKLTHPPSELENSGDRCEHCEIPLGSALPYGVRQIVPFWELDAVLKLDRIFRTFSPSGIEVRLDSDFRMELPHRGCICLGLGFNRLTKRLGCESGAYEVYWEEQTDHFKTRSWNNREKRDLGMRKPDERVDMEYALLARLLLPPSKPVPHVVVAGHTADGTRAACSYLVRHWRKIWKNRAYRKYLDDHHMTAVLYHCDDNADSFEPNLTNPQFVPVHWRTLPAVR